MDAGKTTFLQRLGFGLPDRPAPLPAGQLPLQLVQEGLVHLFARTWGAWAAEHRDEIAAKSPRAAAEWEP